MEFLKRLFNIGSHVNDNRSKIAQNKNASDLYFSTMTKIQQYIAKKDFEGAARYVRENLRYIPEWVKENHRDYGKFVIGAIPALQQGGIVLAIVGDKEGLAEMKNIVNSIPDLKSWNEEVDKHQKEIDLFESILNCITEHPNCKQTDVKELINEKDGQYISNLIYYLEKAGKITRIKTGRTYSLLPAGLPDAPVPLLKRTVVSHRKENTPPKSREIDFNKIDYVPLPRSPLKWEEKQVTGARAKITEPKEHFEVHEADWKVVSIEKIASADRPDPAFRQMYATDTGLLMVDDLGKADGLGQIEAAALIYNRSGNITAKKGLLHSVYRLGVNPCGHGLISLSKECVIHAYDQNLEIIFETSLSGTPEIQAMRKRFDISDGQLKSHIRSVALSREATRYLFTIVDEAWCIDITGNGLWGLKFPIKEGWTRVATPSNIFGTCTDVEHALVLMNMSLPFTPEDFKKRYRELSKKWHPDLNPGNLQAEEKMKDLNSAAEILTGINSNALSKYTGAMFQKDIEQAEFNTGSIKVTITTGLQVGEIFASDWIYASSFAAKSDKVYLAGYSGHIVLVDENGEGVRVYDIGSVPRRIVDTGDYLYMLTDTRLYVLRNDALYVLIDTYDAGDLMIAQTGFGMLEKNRFRWFREDGHYVGSIVSKEPIRRVYSVENGIIVETRQRKAVIQGVPKLWE